MDSIYSHSYHDEETDEVVEVWLEQGEVRNAPPRFQRGSGVGRHLIRRPRGGRPHGGALRPRSGSGGGVVRDPRRPMPRPVPGQVDDGDYISIRKGAIAEIVPALGQLAASFLGRPDAPRAVGDDVSDRNNASKHRAALAEHQQNQTRILALTDLGARVLKLVL